MSPRPKVSFDGEEGEMIHLDPSIMAISWPHSKCQELYDHIGNTTFPNRDWQWQYMDHSTQTRNRQLYHLLEVRIQDAPASWFCNLKML